MGNKNGSYEKTLDVELAMKKFELTSKQLDIIFRVFMKADKDRSGTIDVQEFHILFDESDSPFLIHLFKNMDVNCEGSLNFIEFVHVISTFCLYDEDDMLDFAFTAIDKNRDEFIDMDEFQEFVTLMEQYADNSFDRTDVQTSQREVKPERRTDFPHAVQKAMAMFDEDGNGVIDFGEFRDMNARFPHLLWPLFRLQYHIQEHTLGMEFWKKHRQKILTGESTTRACFPCKPTPKGRMKVRPVGDIDPVLLQTKRPSLLPEHAKANINRILQRKQSAARMAVIQSGKLVGTAPSAKTTHPSRTPSLFATRSRKSVDSARQSVVSKNSVDRPATEMSTTALEKEVNDGQLNAAKNPNEHEGEDPGVEDVVRDAVAVLHEHEQDEDGGGGTEDEAEKESRNLEASKEKANDVSKLSTGSTTVNLGDKTKLKSRTIIEDITPAENLPSTASLSSLIDSPKMEAAQANVTDRSKLHQYHRRQLTIDTSKGQERVTTSVVDREPPSKVHSAITPSSANKLRPHHSDRETTSADIRTTRSQTSSQNEPSSSSRKRPSRTDQSPAHVDLEHNRSSPHPRYMAPRYLRSDTHHRRDERDGYSHRHRSPKSLMEDHPYYISEDRAPRDYNRQHRDRDRDRYESASPHSSRIDNHDFRHERRPSRHGDPDESYSRPSRNHHREESHSSRPPLLLRHHRDESYASQPHHRSRHDYDDFDDPINHRRDPYYSPAHSSHHDNRSRERCAYEESTGNPRSRHHR